VFQARGASLSRVTNGVRSDPTAWTDDRHKRGLAGEEQAIQYLLSRGWHILAHRFRVGHKARRGTAFGSPLEAVTGAKRRELVKAARVWVDRHGRPADVYRFDCIALIDNKLEHLADAFRPGWR